MRIACRQFAAALGVLTAFLVGSAAQAQPTRLLPADTEMVLQINVQQVLKSDIAKSSKTILDIVKGKISEAMEEKGVDKHFKKAGFDLFKDLSSVTMGVPGGRGSDEGFVVIEGNFDAEKIEAAVADATKEASEKFKVTKIANVKAFEITPKEDKTVYIGILDKKTMIMCSSKDDFTNAVARFNGAKKAAFKSESINNLLGTVNNKQSVNLIATSTVLAKMAENAPQGGGDQVKQAMEFLKTMEAFSFALTVQKDIDVQAGANTKDEKTAKEYAGVVNLLLNGAKAKVAEQAKTDDRAKIASDILNTVRATTQGANIVIRGQISFENFEKILQNLPMP